MPIKPRNRKLPQDTEDPAVEAFLAGSGDTAPPPEKKKAPKSPAPAATSNQDSWEARAATAKQTESQLMRYNVRQAELLKHAKQVERRPYSQIIGDIVWPELEARYGKDVPFED